MKIIAKEIEMVAWFRINGDVQPIKFRMKEPGKEWISVRVDKVMDRKKERIAGNEMLVFKCQSYVQGMEKVYEIKYDIESCQWILFKI